MDHELWKHNQLYVKSAVVRNTPLETVQAAGKEKERETSIINPNKEHKVNIDDLSWINTIKTKLNSLCPGLHPSRPSTIFRVPDNIRRADSKAYEPLVVSIGPYHYARAQRGTRFAMQEHKWQCVRHLLSRHRSRERATKLLERCLTQIKALDYDVRSCYSNKFESIDANKLALMMLLDGCFIIHVLLKLKREESINMVVRAEERREQEKYKYNEEDTIELDIGDEEVNIVGPLQGKENTIELDIGDEEVNILDPFQGMLWTWNLMVYDLLKFENQIPFFIIQILFNILKTHVDEGIDLANLALQLFHDIHPDKSKALTKLPKKEFHHILHLFHSTLIPSNPIPSNPTPPIPNTELNITTSPEWIPCATELKLSGIKFRRNEVAKSFLDVSFKDGIMEIPELRIYDYTPSLFRNLIAFEQCYPDTKTYVTIYAAFMDCIVDTADDVKLLDLKGILVNGLSSDEAVANLFNQLCNQIHYASDRNYLVDVFINVKEYHESKWHMWRAGLVRDYFSNPWAGIAVVAAVILFLLTIEQSIFSALSYFYRA